jgi:hypothetical protein
MYNGIMKTRKPGTDLAMVLEQLVRLTRQLATAGSLSPAGASALARLSRNG